MSVQLLKAFRQLPLVAPAATTLSILLIVGGFITYANGFGTPFILDDEAAILKNPTIHTPRLIAPLFFATAPLVAGRPVLNLSFAINYALTHEGVSGYHLVNIFIHLSAAVVLFAIIQATLKLPRLRTASGTMAQFLPFLVSFLWMVHPLQCGYVTYISGRAESLGGLFYLLVIYSFIRATMAARQLDWLVPAVVFSYIGIAVSRTLITVPMRL